MTNAWKMVPSFLCGILFAVGLVVGGMAQPENVRGFLDFFGDWNPRLVGVMGGAVGVHALLRLWILRARSAPLEKGSAFSLPATKTIDAKLVGGAALFGVGWGLAGYCPGPAVVVLGTGGRDAIIFVLAMISGMALFHGVGRLSPKA